MHRKAEEEPITALSATTTPGPAEILSLRGIFVGGATQRGAAWATRSGAMICQTRPSRERVAHTYRRGLAT